jgi:hypothetical protein
MAQETNLADAWAWRATLYGWFPDARASSSITVPGAGKVNVDTNPGSYLSKLEFAFMGTLEARKGPWSFVGDAIYVDFGNQQSSTTTISGPAGSINLPVPVNVHLDLSAFVGTLEAGYALSQKPEARIDVVGGARYMHLTTTVDYEVTVAPIQGSVSTTKDYWDGVIGLRGKSELPNNWFASYYADVGTGSSTLTWQAFAGIGYHFKWGDVLAGYRYLAYEFKSGEPLSDLRLGGPLVGVGFSF